MKNSKLYRGQEKVKGRRIKEGCGRNGSCRRNDGDSNGDEKYFEYLEYLEYLEWISSPMQMLSQLNYLALIFWPFVGLPVLSSMIG